MTICQKPGPGTGVAALLPCTYPLSRQRGGLSQKSKLAPPDTPGKQALLKPLLSAEFPLLPTHAPSGLQFVGERHLFALNPPDTPTQSSKRGLHLP